MAKPLGAANPLLLQVNVPVIAYRNDSNLDDISLGMD